MAGPSVIYFSFNGIVMFVPTRITVLGLERILDPIGCPILRGFVFWLRERTTETSLRCLGCEVLF